MPADDLFDACLDEAAHVAAGHDAGLRQARKSNCGHCFGCCAPATTRRVSHSRRHVLWYARLSVGRQQGHEEGHALGAQAGFDISALVLSRFATARSSLTMYST